MTCMDVSTKSMAQMVFRYQENTGPSRVTHGACECEVCLENANETELELEEERRGGPRPEYQRARAELYKNKGAKKKEVISAEATGKT